MSARPRPTLSTPGRNVTLGAYGEQLAARYLRRTGHEVLDRNWRCADGELDIVARDGRALVFCEVKTRSSAAFGAPVEAVGAAKAARIHGLARQWIEATGRPAAVLRFDVISVLVPAAGRPQLSHLRGAF